MEAIASTLDFILVTINVPLDWEPFLAALRAKGKLHFVGAQPELSAPFFPLLQGSISPTPHPHSCPFEIFVVLTSHSRFKVHQPANRESLIPTKT